MRQAKALSKAEAEAVDEDDPETSVCSYCDRPCGNPGALKNHQRVCQPKLAADAASASDTKERKRSARYTKSSECSKCSQYSTG